MKRPLKTALIALMLATPAPAQFFGGSPAVWRRVSAPCAPTVNLDLTQGTVFQINLCQATIGSFAATGTNAAGNSKADGRFVSIMLCQDLWGYKTFDWSPETLIYGNVDVVPTAGLCTTQAFIVAGNALWAIADAWSATNIRPPSLLRAPLLGAQLLNSGSLTAANESTGVSFTSNGNFDAWQFLGQRTPVASAPVYGVPLNHPFVIRLSFYVENLSPTGPTGFGIADSDSGMAFNFQNRWLCQWTSAAGAGALHFQSFWEDGAADPDGANSQPLATPTNGTGFDNNQSVTTNAKVFTLANPVILELYSTAANGVCPKTCRMSQDNGNTWSILHVDNTSFDCGYTQPGYLWGVVAALPDDTTKIHLTAIEVQ